MCTSAHSQASLADTVMVRCGDPRFKHPSSDAALKLGVWMVLREEVGAQNLPENPHDLRWDECVGISPVHLTAMQLREESPDGTTKQWLEENLIHYRGVGFIGMHQNGDGPQKVVFCTHTTCGANDEADAVKERAMIADDHYRVDEWFRSIWSLWRRSQPLPIIVHLVAIMEGEVGDSDARVSEAIELRQFIKRHAA